MFVVSLSSSYTFYHLSIYYEIYLERPAFAATVICPQKVVCHICLEKTASHLPYDSHPVLTCSLLHSDLSC